MVNSKSKGSQFELKILRQCKLVWPEAHRSIGSGSAKDESGDIFAGPFCIECKHHKHFTDGQIEGFWKKINAEAKEQGKKPLLVYKENRRKALVMFWERINGHLWRRMMFWDEFWPGGGV